MDFEIDEKLKRMITQIAAEKGVSESEVLSDAIKDYALALKFPATQEVIGRDPPKGKWSFVSPAKAKISIGKLEGMKEQFEERFPDGETTEAKSATHKDRSTMTWGLIGMMQNRIFPAIYLVIQLNECIKESKGANWITLDYFKEFSYVKSCELVETMDASPNIGLKEGFPATESKLLRKVSKWMREKRKQDEMDMAREKSRERFLENYVGHYRKSAELYAGPLAEWGLVEMRVEKSGKEWITLSEKGKTMVKVFKNIPKHDFSEKEFSFSTEQIKWILENIIKDFPLEYDAMKMMLKKGSYGNRDLGKRGTEELKEEFYHIQKKYLESEKAQKSSIESLEGKVGRNGKIKEKDRYLIPKQRALATMGRLKELGLFYFAAPDYRIEQLGRAVFAEMKW